MTAATLLQLAREGDGTFSIRTNHVDFIHVDGRCWTMRFSTPSEARGWLRLATS